MHGASCIGQSGIGTALEPGAMKSVKTVTEVSGNMMSKKYCNMIISVPRYLGR